MDLVLIGGNALNMNNQGKRAQALAVDDGKIKAVGTSAQISKMIGEKTKVVNLVGRTVTPGLIDPHNHFSMTLFEPVSVDCRTPPLYSKQGALSAISLAASATPTGQWIWGQAYRHRQIGNTGPLTKEELDEVSGDHPVCIMDDSYHALYANSAALALAGIDKNTPDPHKGWIVRDRAGEPTGFLQERAMDLIHRITMRNIIERYGDRHTVQ